ncbi:heavy metal-responsive transcriptional regulator [Tessaracoccus sp. OS52]|uniref:heavy metal-responsive transcriptional regulator n=1 Tax=Tessaracoccus sp. OS52 TaxID=2886691 RepID=UPI001D1254E3|nr:heavy metal-responsive transcriptional regulator [Tessaracoccus sp. OS52]MCC2592513.1 heavy metal-responsive transcriptional regulator [Tessaracoccus sp. OS52]
MRIGQVAQAAGVTTKTLRFYEDVGLLRPAGRTSAGYRDFDPDVLERLDFIRRGQAAGLTLAQVRQVLQIRDDGQAPCGHVTQLLTSRLEDIDRQVAQLERLRATVADLRDQAAGADPTACLPEDVCRYL